MGSSHSLHVGVTRARMLGILVTTAGGLDQVQEGTLCTGSTEGGRKGLHAGAEGLVEGLQPHRMKMA